MPSTEVSKLLVGSCVEHHSIELNIVRFRMRYCSVAIVSCLTVSVVQLSPYARQVLPELNDQSRGRSSR